MIFKYLFFILFVSIFFFNKNIYSQNDNDIREFLAVKCLSEKKIKFSNLEFVNTTQFSGEIWGHKNGEKEQIGNYLPYDTFYVETKDFDKIQFYYVHIYKSGNEEVIDNFSYRIKENEEFKRFISFVKKPDAIDNTTIPFSHEEFIDLLAGDMGLSGLLYTIKIEDDADPREISVTPLESENYIDISEMDSSTFEVQVRLKSFDELKRNTGIESKGWNRDVPPFPIGVILKDNSGTNHEKEISLMFQKFKKGKGN